MSLVIGGFFQGVGQRHHGLTHEVLHFLNGHVLRPKIHVNGISVLIVPQSEGHGFCRPFLHIAIFCTPANGRGNFVFIRRNGNGYLRIGHDTV